MSSESPDERPVLVTGTAGFIGFHVARRLLEAGRQVVGIDGYTPYYDVSLKRARHAILAGHDGFSEHAFMLEDAARVAEVVDAVRPAAVIHLAAQAGVRYSLENPRAYVDANVVGTFNVLEACRARPPAHLLLASSSSVYGNGAEVPFREASETSEPVSLYAATKKAGEVIARAYAHLHALPTTCFRFFTVYGPWGRPDMALFKFTAAILEGREIELYGEGRLSRDFTYVDDIAAAIVGLVGRPPEDAGTGAPFRIVNIGASRPVGLEEFVAAIEAATGKKALRRLVAAQPGDVERTWADVGLLRALDPCLVPATPVAEGVAAFVDWFRSYYGVA